MLVTLAEVSGMASIQSDGYNTEFYELIDAGAIASARAIVPRVMEILAPTSVVDVGCGSGAWLRVFQEFGADDVLGIDGAHVPDTYRTPGRFLERDLAQPLRLDRRFDLVSCLEVGEHLPGDRSAGLVEDLIALAPAALFSAAIPGQRGRHHINLQWTEHWVSQFESHGWTCWDAVRPWIRSDDTIDWWYRQNIFIAVASPPSEELTWFPRLDGSATQESVDYKRRVVTPAPTPTLKGAARMALHAFRRQLRSSAARTTR